MKEDMTRVDGGKSGGKLQLREVVGNVKKSEGK